MHRKAFALINDPRLNKGTAFTLQEREENGLHGLLPPRISTMAEQVEWALDSIRRKPQDIDKYRFMASMMKRNERLHFRLLIDHIEELMPIVYTPTVGQACQEYAYQFRETSGFYVSIDHKGRIDELMNNWIDRDVRLIVVTDGERTWVNSTGNSGMATAGSGDVLTGVVVSLLGQNSGAFEAAAIAVCAHGLAGDAAAERWTRRGLIASDLLNFLPEAWRRLDPGETSCQSV